MVRRAAKESGQDAFLERFDALIEVSERENQMAKQVDEFVTRNFRPVKWAKMTFVMTLIFLVSTMLVHFYKADFVNLTVVTVSIFLLHNADKLSAGWFRLLVAGIILSIGYDITWFVLRSWEMEADEDGDGGVEKTIRRFSLIMAIISLILKVVMSVVFWMASIKYEDVKDERAALL